MKIFKDILFCRYEHTACHNVTYFVGDRWLHGIPLDADMLTYEQLIAQKKLTLSSSESSGQQFANWLTTLRSFLVFVGKTEASPIGTELNRQFDKMLRDYSGSLLLSERTIRDRRSHLKSWQELAEALREVGQKDRAEIVQLAGANFAQNLRLAMTQHDTSVAYLAQAVRVVPDTLQDWLRGSVPKRKMRPAVARIETHFGLAPGCLSQFIAESAPQNKCPPAANLQSDPFRNQLKERAKLRYRIQPRNFPPALLDELAMLFEYKTTRRPNLKRNQKGLWRADNVSIRPDISPLPFKPQMCSPTYNMFANLLGTVLGFVCLSQAEGGLGRPVVEANTLAWLALPDKMDKFMEFLTNRSKGKVHGGQAQIAQAIISLVQHETGYLTQQPEFATRLPIDVQPENWSKACAETHSRMSEWKRDGWAGDKNRSPDKPIAGLLSLPEPFAPVLRAVRKLDEMAQIAPEGSKQEAVNKRNALLLTLLLANPLRIKNYRLMRLQEGASGCLYRSGDSYRISIPKSGFKNAKSGQFANYDVGLSAFLTPRIEEYLEIYRPRLVGQTKDEGFLFPNNDGTLFRQIAICIFTLTRTLIPETLGFGPQAFRHLVATVWLTRHPDAYLVVAELLNDKLQTVLKNYTHLRKEDSLTKHGQFIQTVWDKLTP